MKPGRIIFAVMLLGALIWGYSRSMAPIIRYEHVAQPVPPSVAAVAGAGKAYAAYTQDGQLYAAAWNDERYVKIQGVYRSPHDGAVEVAVFERELDPGETAAPDTVRIRLPADKWPDVIVFRDLTGNLVGRAPVAAAPAHEGRLPAR